ITSQPDEPVVVDSREELIRQLAEYRRYRTAAMALHGMATEQSKRLSRRNAGRGSLPTNFQPVELWDLVSAYARLIRETRTASVERVVVDFVPLPVIIDEILQLVNLEEKISLKRLVGPNPSRPRLIGLFLAILELLKTGEILAGQELLYGDIWIISANGSQPSEPIIADASSS
ncbi:MAG: segregation and condensation protein A, partial [Planctomycetota bacterium]